MSADMGTQAEIERAAWCKKIIEFLFEHPKLKVPPEFDPSAMAKDLRQAELRYCRILEPQEREHLTGVEACALMARLHGATRNLKLILSELAESPGNRRHLVETIDRSRILEKDWHSTSEDTDDIDEDGEALLSQIEASISILDTQSRALWEQYEARDGPSGRHSRSAAAVFSISTSSKAWLIGTKLPEIYEFHFGSRPPINHSAKAGQSTRTGVGLDFIYMALDQMKVRHWTGGEIPAETIRSIVRKARGKQKTG